MFSSPGPSVSDLSLYGGQDPRELPRYTYNEASRATGVPASTIAAWVRGMPYASHTGQKAFFEPVIRRPTPRDSRLSFLNLIEAYVLRALRESHNVRVSTVRRAIDIAQQLHGIDRLLASTQLKTSGGELFLDTYFTLETLSPSAQFAMRDLMKLYLKRVHIDDWLESEICPIPKTPEYKDRELISVSPFVAFGRPRIRRVGVSTHAIAERIDVGERREDVMQDYRLTEDEFTEAILYESGLQAAA